MTEHRGSGSRETHIALTICMVLVCCLLSACSKEEEQEAKPRQVSETFVVPTPTEVPSVAIYDEGVAAMNSGDWNKAIECFTGLEYQDSVELLEKCVREKGMTENADYDFLETMSQAVMRRYEESKKDGTIDQCTAIEMELLGGFKNAVFYDERLRELAMSYIEGVERERESISKEFGQQQIIYNEGHAKRFETLKKMTDEYGLLADNLDYKINYYNKVDQEVEYYIAIQAIEADLDDQLNNDNYVYFGFVDDITARLTIRNNTAYDYDMDMYFIFYDADDTIIATNEVYYASIKAGMDYNLDFYFPLEAYRYEYATEEYPYIR